MEIVHICSEANPFVKTGGLADVTYSLSRELVKTNSVSIILPLYNQARRKTSNLVKVCSFDINMSWRREGTNIYFQEYAGIKYYFVENRNYFERDSIYGYADDGERFAFFVLAAIETLKQINLKPDIIHLHDWQVGMVPVVIKENKMSFFENTKYVISIHNAAFLGYLDKYSLGNLFNLSDECFDNGKVRLNDRVSTLKAGIMYCDKVVAVSPTNRDELLTAEQSNGLDGAFRLREFDFKGILNGIDYEEFNPETDPYIPYKFTNTNFTSNKLKNKVALAKMCSFKNPEAPLYSLVSRITWQKGMTLVFAAVRELVARGANIILLGSGEPEYENEMRCLHATYPTQVACYTGYNNELAHQIYAASDFFMMPSLFEPCGLGQMIAERYGTLPIVRRTGGLRDSVINYDGKNEKTSNGFGFDPFTEYEMVRTCLYALDVYNNKELLKKLRSNAMKTNNTWEQSGKEYFQLYSSIK